MGLREGILALARFHSGSNKECAEQEDLLGVFGLTGDDATEFLETYARTFDVDLSAMRWEFHFNADEPPQARRLLPVGADGKVIPWQPITLEDLERAAQTGWWDRNYPAHQLRVSIWSRFAMVGSALALFLVLFGLARFLV